MIIAIDTEFNDFQGELISMGLVAEDGKEFYEVLGCHDPSPWVRKNVISVLNKAPVTRSVFQRRLGEYLLKFKCIELIADWPEDIAHFCQSLITGPGMALCHPPLEIKIMRGLSSEGSIIPHNALEDARAIMRDLKS